MYMATFVTFATWFGAETVLGASSTMAKEGLVSLFVPLAAGLYFKGSNSLSAILSMLSGFFSWGVLEYIFHSEFALLVGLTFSLVSYLLFDAEERVDMFSQMVKDLKKVEVKSFDGLLVIQADI